MIGETGSALGINHLSKSIDDARIECGTSASRHDEVCSAEDTESPDEDLFAKFSVEPEAPPDGVVPGVTVENCVDTLCNIYDEIYYSYVFPSIPLRHSLLRFENGYFSYSMVG